MLCSTKIFPVTLLECINNCHFIYRADLKFIHYAGELGGATDIIPGEYEGIKTNNNVIH